jgi:hypothetical protein
MKQGGSLSKAIWIVTVAVVLSACGARPMLREPMPAPPPPPVVDRALEDRILALDPERITPAEVRERLLAEEAP